MTEKQQTHGERLNKLLALRLGVSRREADLLIEQGAVAINGTSAKLGQRFTPHDSITVKGKTIPGETDYIYLLLHKPTGYVCSRKRQGDAPTIYELLPKELHSLKPVGRLDKDSSGLILLTNNGDFAHKMTHPSFAKTKCYQVVLDKELEPLHQQMINDYGIQLEDGPSRMTLERQSDNNRTDWTILMHEGRNRQIRRTFAAIGYTVIKLHRTEFGNYLLGDIKPGEWQTINIS